MRLLLDTHAFLWWLVDHRSLSRKAHAAIADRSSDVFVSAATAWEITTKSRLCKLPEADAVSVDILAAITAEGFQPLPVSVAHGQLAGALPGDHRDPFDRILIAQAMLEQLLFVTNEIRFDAFAVRRLW